jgi:Tfp pilus assembly protein PilF
MASLSVGAVQAQTEPDTAQAAADRPAVPLPPGLPDILLPPEPRTEAHTRLLAPVEDALQGIGPAEFPHADKPDGGELPPQSGRALDQAQQLLAEGRYFEALNTLRDAERLSPDHPRVVRTVGMAQVLSGNSVRGLAYLRRAAAMDPADTGVRVLLARLALDRGEWRDALSLAASIDTANASADAPDPAAACFARIVRAVALDRQGYAAAAVRLYTEVLDGFPETDAATVTGRELYIVQQGSADLRVRLGDLALRCGDPGAALLAYGQADAARVSDPRGLAARQTYALLLSTQREAAAGRVVAFLASPAADEDDAALALYLVQQGVDAESLDTLLVGHQDAGQPASIAIVAARAALLPQAQTVGLIDTWLSTQPESLATFRRAMGLLRRGHGPEDPEAIAQALLLTHHAMRRHPDQANDYADATLDTVGDPVALLRALRRPEIADTDDPALLMLTARGYLSAGRAEDARAALERAHAIDPADDALALALAQVLLQLAPQEPARLAQAALLLGEPEADAPWDQFVAHIDLLRLSSRLRDAQRLLRERLARNSGDLDLLLLDARVRLESMNTAPAVQSLESALDRYPREERLYAAAIAFTTLVTGSERDRAIYAAFYPRIRERLLRHLPDSRTARLEQARDLIYSRLQPGLAIPILTELDAAGPADPSVLVTLWRAYEEIDDQPMADATLLRLIHTDPPSVRRTIELTGYYSLRGDPAKAAELARAALDLEAEGVMPGPGMTGDDAGLLLFRLSAVVEDEEIEPYYLAMLRRFPDSARLNNALGYRWAQAGRELLSAEVMIRRAIEQGGEVSAYLDSLGWVLYKMGRFAEAEAMLRLALIKLQQEQRLAGRNDNASRAIYCDHLGDTLYRMGEVAAAVRQWVAARDMEITDREAASDPEVATVNERCAAKVVAVRDGVEPPVAEVPGEAALGAGGHPADPAP